MNTQILIDSSLLLDFALASLDARFASVFGHNTKETAVLAHVALSHVLPRAPRSETIEVPLSLIENAGELKVAQSFSVLMDLPSEGLNVRLFIVVEEIWGDTVFLRVCRREDLSEIVKGIATLGAESAIWENDREEASRLEALAIEVGMFLDLDPTAREEGADIASQIQSLSFETEKVKVSPDLNSVKSRVVSCFDIEGSDEDIVPVLWTMSSLSGIKIERGPLGARVRLVSLGSSLVFEMLKEAFSSES
jgi:hypothetical protein